MSNLIVALLILGCMSSGPLFKNSNIQRSFESFVSNAHQEYPQDSCYFQIIAAHNSLGTKFDFIATKAPLEGPLYFYEPTELFLFGHFDTNNHPVSVYISGDGDYCDVFSIKGRSLSPNYMVQQETDKIIPIKESFQLYNDGRYELIPDNDKISIVEYSLSFAEGEGIIGMLVLSEQTHYYEIVLPDTIVGGTWKIKDDMVELFPSVLYRYSTVRNEMVSFPVRTMRDIIDLTTREVVNHQRYIMETDRLMPLKELNDNEPNAFFWKSVSL